MVTQKVVLRNEKKRKNGLVPLSLRVTKSRKHSYSLIDYILPANWDINKERVKGTHPNSSRLNAKISNLRSKVQNITLELESTESFFGANTITKLLKDDNRGNLIEYANRWVEKRYEDGIITFSTKVKYEAIINKLKKYSKDQLLIHEFHSDYIKRYKRYLSTTIGNSKNTISSNLSCLRAICNSLIEEGLMKLEDYPFRRIKLEFEDTQRGFLTPEDIEKFRSVIVEKGTNIAASKDIFLFCLETGFRIGETLLLQQNDIKADQIYYYSQKTKDYVYMPLTSRAKDILNKHKIMNEEKTIYVFDFLKNSNMASEKSSLIELKRKTALINKYLKTLEHKAKITTHISTHLARHSLATNALSQGLSYAEIQSILNHKDVKTTQIYAKTHDQFKKAAIAKLNL